MQVDQLHRIHRLCGTPSEEYWRKIRLPSNLKHANNMPKPQVKRKVREEYKAFSPEALSLVDRLLALDPLDRLTATDALMSDVSVSARPVVRFNINLTKLTQNKVRFGFLLVRFSKILPKFLI